MAMIADIKAEFTAVKTEFAEVKSTLRLHGWILSFNTAMIVALVGKAFLGGH